MKLMLSAAMKTVIRYLMDWAECNLSIPFQTVCIGIAGQSAMASHVSDRGLINPDSSY